MDSEKLSHLDSTGDARMVDVGGKETTRRSARAGASIRMNSATREQVTSAPNPKGAVLAPARLAGIQAAKRTSDLVPLCHPLPLDHVEVVFSWDSTQQESGGEVRLLIETTARVTARTGVEMEALTGATVAALTIYDMTKGLDHGILIEDVGLLEKRGGRSGLWRSPSLDEG